MTGHSRSSTFITRTHEESSRRLDLAPAADGSRHPLGRGGDPDPDGVLLGHLADAGADEGEGVAAGDVAGAELLAGGLGVGDAVEAEGAPVLAVAVVGDEVPAAAEGDEAVGLDPAVGAVGVAGGVAEPQRLVVAAGLGEGGEDGSVDDGSLGPRAGGVGLRGDGVHPAAQPGRHQADHLGERLHRGLLQPADAGDARGRGGAQPDGDRHRLVVLEEQRRELAARAQLVAAGDAAAGVDLVAEVAQPLDVAAQRAAADLEAGSELVARPVAVGLEQRQQAEHPGAGGHGVKTNSDCGQKVA